MPAEGPPVAVPANLPGCLLVYLAAQAGWVDRVRLAALFWPDRLREPALNNLRANLHRVHVLLDSWGCGAALQGDRQRVLLRLPTDLDGLRTALTNDDAWALVALSPADWLSGFRTGAFPNFWEWADEQAAQWTAAWRTASGRAMAAALAAGQAEVCASLIAAWQQNGAWAMPELQRLDPMALAPPLLDLWRALRDCTPASGASGTAALSPQALPGREPVLRALRASGAPATLVIGEPGVGKTALLGAAYPEATMLHGREALSSVPYSPVLECLRERGIAWLHRALQQQGNGLAAYRLDLARLLPDLAPDEPLPALDAQTARSRLLEALSRLFETTGSVLLVDDLQWCDPATLEWLAFLAWRHSLRWVASVRSADLASGQAGQLVERLRAAQDLNEILLPVLSRAAVGEACRQRWPQRTWSEAAIALLHAASGGNPFVLAQLVAMNAERDLVDGRPIALPRRVQNLVLRHLRTLGPSARAVVEAAAVLSQPVAPSLMREVVGDGDDTAFLQGCEEALRADLLRESGGRLQCRHDLIRAAALSALGDVRRLWLHRRAALALAAQLLEAEPLAIAAHWRAAQEPQLALAWMHRGAHQQKERGDFDAAQALWREVAEQSADMAQSLRARLALAEFDLLHDLARGRSALELVLSAASAVADPAQRADIEGQALAGLVDNAVFAGDMARAGHLAPRLLTLLPSLQARERAHACEVLIERAMRVPDIAGAWALHAQLAHLAPRWPVTLSMGAQIHWAQGDVRAARDAFEDLLARHPDHCRGLTIENDLAVMLHALGELPRAELMARRSLENWRGTPHTEALSLRVLGSILTSAGRDAEARVAFDEALQRARQQSSGLLESDTLVRRAHLLLLSDDPAQAGRDLAAAQALLQDNSDPLIVSNHTLACVRLDMANGLAPQPALAERLRTLGQRSSHPLLHARLAHIECCLALAAGQPEQALLCAQRQADIARGAGLLEPLAEALLCQAELAGQLGPHRRVHRPAATEALALAQAQGFARLARRAQSWLASCPAD